MDLKHLVNIARQQSALTDYSRAGVPTSPLKTLSGNKIPGKTPITWLKGHNKCNQFVGDVLTRAGLKMPTFKMKDGSEHYANAEALPRFNSHFKSIASKDSIRPGDIIVIDDLRSRGENSAHTEMLTESTGSYFKTIGARRTGVQENDKYSQIIANSKWQNGAFISPDKNYALHFLRPSH